MKFLFLPLLLAATPALAAYPASTPLFAAKLHDLDDKSVALAQYQGKALVVNFWARWCAPCRAEIPELIRFREANRGSVEVLGIGLEDEAKPAKAFAQTQKINYPVLIAKQQGIPLMQALGNRVGALPYTLFINRQGEVVGVKVGLLKAADLDEALPALKK